MHLVLLKQMKEAGLTVLSMEAEDLVPDGEAQAHGEWPSPGHTRTTARCRGG